MDKNTILNNNIVLHKIFLLKNLNIYKDIINFIINLFFDFGKVKIITLPDLFKNLIGHDSDGFDQYKCEGYTWNARLARVLNMVNFNIGWINFVYTDYNRLKSIELKYNISYYSYNNSNYLYNIYRIYTIINGHITYAIYSININKIYLYL
jgi:hypothetical protein